MGVGLGDGLPVHGIGAVLGGLEGHGGFYIGHQLHVGHGDHGVGAGAAGLDVDSCRSASSQLLGECTISSNGCSIDLNGAVMCIDSIVEGQRRLCGLVVGDDQRRIVGCVRVAHPLPRRRLSRTDDLRAAGAPRVVRVARKTQADVLVG